MLFAIVKYYLNYNNLELDSDKKRAGATPAKL